MIWFIAIFVYLLIGAIVDGLFEWDGFDMCFLFFWPLMLVFIFICYIFGFVSEWTTIYKRRLINWFKKRRKE